MTFRERLKNMNTADLRNMTEPQIFNLAKKVVSLLNPGINRLGNKIRSSTKYASNAYDWVMKRGLFTTTRDTPITLPNGEISYRKTRNELIAEINRGIQFVNMESSTQRGAREVVKYGMSILTEDQKRGKSEEELRQMVRDEWENFGYFIEENKLLMSSYSNTYAPGERGREMLKAYHNRDGKALEAQKQKIIQMQETEPYEKASQRTGYSSSWNMDI